jgi:fibronectin type 3 domain-containing protein
MDQDQDGVAGESPDDRFTGAFTLEPLTLKFDFGTSSSPVEPGWQQVVNTTTYSGSSGFGWQAPVLGVHRPAGTALTRDLNFGNDITFLADLPEGVYDITLTMGDTGGYSHDLMGVFIEGAQVDTVSTGPGQIVTRTHRASVQDGQLTLRLHDLGGSDANAVIAGLEIVLLGEDTAGPRVVGATPSGTVGGPIDRITLTFNEPVLDGTFTLPDIVSLTGPNGPITPTAVNRMTAVSYEIVFAPQSTGGEYSVTIGPDVLDEAGNLMDQDGDGTEGEPIEDRFTATFSLITFFERFDFGTASSPVQPGYHQVLGTTTYSAATGFGWLTSVSALDRTSGSALDRDLHFGRDMTFVVDAPSGAYDVTVRMGDTGPWGHDQMGVFLEGAQVGTITSAPRQVVVSTFRVIVADGQLTLRLRDLGGTDLNAVINGLELLWVGSATAGEAMAVPVGSEPLSAIDSSGELSTGPRRELPGVLPADVIAWFTLLGDDPGAPAASLRAGHGSPAASIAERRAPDDPAGTRLDDLFASADLALELDSF